jgi:cystathionine gamma-synthase
MLSVRLQLAKRLLEKFGTQDELNLLLPSGGAAKRCRAFMQRFYVPEDKQKLSDIRIAEFEISPTSTTSEMSKVPIYIVLFPSEAFKFAKMFWQHSGDILSSRMAEYALRILDDNAEIEKNAGSNGSPEQTTFAPKPKSRSHRHYSRQGSAAEVPITQTVVETPDHEHLTYVEERYGRNLNLMFADKAKIALRRRIAGVMTESEQTMKVEDLVESNLIIDEQKKRQGERGVSGLSESDVYLFPCGMSAIFNAHRFAMGALDATRQSICYG